MHPTTDLNNIPWAVEFLIENNRYHDLDLVTLTACTDPRRGPAPLCFVLTQPEALQAVAGAAVFGDVETGDLLFGIDT